MATITNAKALKLTEVKVGPSIEELRALECARECCFGWMQFSAAGLSALTSNDYSLLTKKAGGQFAVAASAQPSDSIDVISATDEMVEAVMAGGSLVFQVRAFDNEGSGGVHGARFSLSAIVPGADAKLLQLGTFAYDPTREVFIGLPTGGMEEFYKTLTMAPMEFDTEETKGLQALVIYGDPIKA